MKEFRELKNGGLFKLENHSEHNHLSTFLTLLNLAEYKKSQSFTNCTLPYNEDKEMTVKEFIQANLMSSSHTSLENLFKVKNSQKLFELINFRIDEDCALKNLETADLNMLVLIKALLNNSNKPIFLHFEKDCSFAQNAITRIFSFIQKACELNSLSIFICGEYPIIFDENFKYKIVRSQNNNFELNKVQNDQIQRETELKISA